MDVTGWSPRIELDDTTPDGMPSLVWRTLRARGFKDRDQMQRWLNPSLRELRDPFLLKDMDRAVARLLTAFERQESICLYCDYDLDGTSACAMLLSAFQTFGYKNVRHYQPKRLSEGYGLHREAIARLAKEGVTLLVTADLGITAIDETEFANSLEMDVIISDHHLPKETLPNAMAVVNPNQPGCNSGLGHLCGTGVAFYLILALRRGLLERGWLTRAFDPKSLLDCFVIGTVTDLVPLIAENRVLVKHGLLALSQTQRPGLRVLLQALGLWGNPLTSQDVAIRFAPKLNALSRMERGIQPLDLYLVEDENQAHLLVNEVIANNQIRQNSQRVAEDEAYRQLQENPQSSACFVWSDLFHRGVIGLVATKIVQDFKLPAFVGSLQTDDQRIYGSARLPDGSGLNLLDALHDCRDLLSQFGGHAVACGFELEAKHAEELRQRLQRWFAERFSELGADALGSGVTQPRVRQYDVDAQLEEFNPTFLQWYDHLGPFGVQFSAPLYRLRRVRVAQARELRGGHLRLTFEDGNRNSKTAVWFRWEKSAIEALGPSELHGSWVDVLVEPQWNYFAGRKDLQLLIQDLRRSSET